MDIHYIHHTYNNWQSDQAFKTVVRKISPATEYFRYAMGTCFEMFRHVKSPDCWWIVQYDMQTAYSA